MLVRSARTVTTASRHECLRVSQFGAIDFNIGLTLTSDYFAKEAQIFGEGDPSENVYQVVTGAVRSCKLLSDGRCQITAFHLPGDIFGFDLSALRPTSAEAIVDTTLRTAKRRSLQQAAATNAAVGSELWCLTASKLKHAEDHLLLLGRKTALERVAAFLVEMDGRLDGNGNLPLPMRRRDIGDYLGLTIETVSRVLSALHDEGIIGFSGDARHIVLRNRHRLRTMELSRELA
jgi:CRP/FNR family nitrogen fixation transcriptional regulator